ncbi:hypothetical protein D3C78_1624840 [compost metagenome]
MSSPQDFLQFFSLPYRDDVDAALAQIGGINHHDYFVELHKASGVPEMEIFRNAFHFWLVDHEAACLNFVRNVLAKTK